MPSLPSLSPTDHESEAPSLNVIDTEKAADDANVAPLIAADVLSTPASQGRAVEISGSVTGSSRVIDDAHSDAAVATPLFHGLLSTRAGSVPSAESGTTGDGAAASVDQLLTSSKHCFCSVFYPEKFHRLHT